MKYDYSSIGFYTFDCLGWPVTDIPKAGGTIFIDELAMAVSGAAGTAAIAAAKMGLRTQAVGGLGTDMMEIGFLDGSSILALIPRRFPRLPARELPRPSSSPGPMGRVRLST